MNHQAFNLIILAILTLLLAAVAPRAVGDGYDLTWHSFDAGGGTSAGGQANEVVLTGTVGQPDAGIITGGSEEATYTLVGGFWIGGSAQPDDPDPPVCAGDLSGDSSVGVADLLALLACWGEVDPNAPGDCAAADLTNGGGVGVADLLALLAAWGDCP